MDDDDVDEIVGDLLWTASDGPGWFSALILAIAVGILIGHYSCTPQPEPVPTMQDMGQMEMNQ